MLFSYWFSNMKVDSLREGNIVGTFSLCGVALRNDDGGLRSLFDGQFSEFRDNLKRKK